jgi:hypothetical protein
VCGFGRINWHNYKNKNPTFSLAEELAIPLPLLLVFRPHQQFPFLWSLVVLVRSPVTIGLYAEKEINITIENKILFVGLFLYTFFL